MRPMILESIVTTINDDGSLNVSPMGPLITDDVARGFELRPFNTSTTFANLKARKQGVMHITDDVLLFAKSAIGRLDIEPPVRKAEKVIGQILTDACRWYEFDIVSIDDSSPRVILQCQTVFNGRQRDFWGFNRAKHAIIEAAILATRVSFLPREEISSQFVILETNVEKTGGDDEFAAMKLLKDFVDEAMKSQHQTD